MTATPAYQKSDARPKKAPAFQYYPDDFEQGTATFTIAEVGGYQRLLNHQWAHHCVPGDNIKALSLIMRCTPKVAASVWKTIHVKFQKHGENDWRNERMEIERQKQADYRARQGSRGKAGATARWGGDDGGSDGASMAPAIAPAIAQAMPKQWPDDGSPSPSPKISQSLSPDPTTPPSQEPPTVASSPSSSPLVMSPLRYAKLQASHAFVGSRLQVPNVLHDELRRRLGGDGPHAVLLAWYRELDAEIEHSGEAIPDVFEWLRPKFKVWCEARNFTSELAQIAARKAMR